ncbi:MAG: Thiamine pyrophosphate protein domain protein TPP-binding protein [Candidatus Magasanikbacteria bacterium GW2011_GWD2_43_18]|uniref:Thiamine pyrophosphate protein domain protein TPP-binding protein n=1 Tax=Candidatus Magasanikbacteria bacterium GW2011_GWE2_42_7 TaxID=1619052 RepID=A0A0G1DIU3_9BACT|nr:MAG: Thiamine pyrophosphate protein domain protein TPP-binding protein [Candidatus Magasanikbacteria bacterium GW2011_GWC2_42_27]KKS70741.1 MAG: Thiamine pyrophosphate protein domain protein TPP-binding protein [Candidatus Magasanikbacteria bacterium GW2011_GWE2_42_7]KKT04193.1 MAG: Thiamine pyrophosphate protein domain protein TPP-binding protein [Candidatus Magasanikbacteria bacterium GW2011_GWD2_43_18]KKT25888.1 MAG: Thiamine pyrophosphate protein domain protein TPP-binding protein [Candid
MKASDLFIKALENEGVEYIFGVPGEENLDFVESLRTSSIRLIVTRHEQVAGFMAATYGRLTGKPGVCLSTLGPGATNFVTAAAYATLGGMPMLMITGQKPILSSKQGHFQIVDIVNLMKPVTKYTTQIVSAKTIPARVREAFRVAVAERPGAVHIELPEDIAAQDVPDPVHVFPVDMIRRPAAEEKAVAKAVEMILAAKRPLILVGAGANRKLVSKALTEFVDDIGIPFFTTQMGKGVIDERHPLYLGTAALSSNDYVHCAIEKADLIINVGHDVIEKPPFFMTHGGTKVIHVNYSSASVDDVYFPQWEVIGDIGNAVWQMKERLKQLLDGTKNQWDMSAFERVKNDMKNHLFERSMEDVFPIIPQRFVSIVREVMPDDGIVALDNGMYKLWFARQYEARGRNTILLDNALATMGAGMPSAMGARLVYPEKKILAVVGDGGFMMNSQDLETAVREKMHLVVLILNDSGYGMIQWKQHAMGFDAFGLEFGNPNFVTYAESYGAKGYRAESVSHLKELLTHALDTPDVHVIEVAVDYSENERVLTKGLKSKTCTC